MDGGSSFDLADETAESLLGASQSGLGAEQRLKVFETLMRFMDGSLQARLGLDFDVWQWELEELYGLTLGMLYSVMAPHYFDIPLVEWLDFVVEVEQNYRQANPYHNFRHAMDVTYTNFYILNDLGAVRFFVQIDLVVAIISALCHDLSHPGLNNVYQVNKKTELALRFQNVSVLENYSVSQALLILNRRNMMRNLDPSGKDAQYFREALQALILSTDMVQHFHLLSEYVSAVDQMISQVRKNHTIIMKVPTGGAVSASQSSALLSGGAHGSSRPLSAAASILSRQSSFNQANSALSDNNEIAIQLPLSPPHRLTFMKVLLHAADISNPCRPFRICRLWSDLVREEFFRQGDCEKQDGLPVSPNMNRETDTTIAGTLGFIDVIVRPYFEGVANFIKEMHVFIDNLDENRKCWLEHQQQQQQRRLSVSTATTATSDAISDSHSLDDGTAPVTPVDILRKNSIHGRRMSFAAGVVTIPDEQESAAAIAQSNILARLQTLSIEFSAPSLDDIHNSAHVLATGTSENSKSRKPSPTRVNGNQLAMQSPLRSVHSCSAVGGFPSSGEDSNEPKTLAPRGRRKSGVILPLGTSAAPEKPLPTASSLSPTKSTLVPISPIGASKGGKMPSPLAQKAKLAADKEDADEKSGDSNV